MIRQRDGTILGISSSAGSQGVERKSAYSASTHGGLMKTVAAEMRGYGISANAIHPGGRVDVDGRGGVTPVVVPLVLFLCGQDSPAVTGKSIRARDWNERRFGLHAAD